MAANKGLQMAKKPSGGVRRRGETRDQFRGRMDNISSAIDAVFRGVQQTRTRVHKGLSGMQLNPDGTDPGNSFDRFMRQNPHLGGAAQRQAQYDQQARGNMASAVAEREALQKIQTNTPSSKSVVGADGYRSIFDQQGNVVGTTAPVGEKGSRVFDDALGEMVPMDAWSQRKNYVQGTKGMNATAMQQAARKSITSKPSKPSGIDQIFGGGTKQTSPSGGTAGDLVGSSGSQGAPGGEPFGLPQWVLDQEMKKSLPKDALRNGQSGKANTPGPAISAAPSSNGQNFYSDPWNYEGFVPNQEQTVAMRRLLNLGNMQARTTDLFPGDDYAYLESIFPGFKFSNYPTPNAGLDALRELMKLYQ